MRVATLGRDPADLLYWDMRREHANIATLAGVRTDRRAHVDLTPRRRPVSFQVLDTGWH